MKWSDRFEGALLGAGAMLMLGQVPPFTFITEEPLTIPAGAIIGGIWGPKFIKKLKKDLF